VNARRSTQGTLLLGALALAAVLDSPGAALGLVPLLAVALSLILGRYPGEDRIVRLRERCPQAPARAPHVLAPRPPDTYRACARQAIAYALANRPPPATP
jgi:hypothetical protein